MGKPLEKTCNCCKTVHTAIPENARYSDELGWFWECKCNSTMFVPTPEVAAALEAKKAKRAA